MKRLAALLLMLLHITANAFSFSCMAGASCIASQGTKIPSKTAIWMLERCEDFTRNDIGRRVLSMSVKQTLEATNGQAMHPLNVASYAYDQLAESPLRFDRRQRLEDTKYIQIKLACAELLRDFNNDAKWSR